MVVLIVYIVMMPVMVLAYHQSMPYRAGWEVTANLIRADEHTLLIMISIKLAGPAMVTVLTRADILLITYIQDNVKIVMLNWKCQLILQ